MGVALGWGSMTNSFGIRMRGVGDLDLVFGMLAVPLHMNS